MTNSCRNELWINGEDKSFSKVRNVIKKHTKDGEIQLLSAFIPHPKELENVHSGGCLIDGEKVSNWVQKDGTNVAIPKQLLVKRQKEYGATNLYDWHCNEWGTKWDVDAYVNYDDKESIHLDFDSAWSPPVRWLEKMSKKYPKVKFTLKYEEPGCCFMGVAKAFGGVVNDQYIEWGD